MSAVRFRIGIDGSNIRAGGGITHLSRLLDAADPSRHSFSKIWVWSGRETLDAIQEKPWLTKFRVPELEDSVGWRTYWQQSRLPDLLRETGCDLLFSPGGTLPFRLRLPAVIMSQNLLPFQTDEYRRTSLLTWERTRLWILRHAQARAMANADGTIFLSQFAKAVVFSVLSRQPERAAVIPHGIEPRFVCEPRPAIALGSCGPERPFRLLYVSTVFPYKHQWQVAHAVARLRARGIPISVDFIGGGYLPSVQRLKSAIEDLDPSGTFLRYLGTVPFGEVDRAYRNADAFIFASTCETFGNIVLEAMASGLPIACSAKGPMAELLGSSAVYFDSENVSSIEEAIVQLASDPALRLSIAREAFERARAFSWERCADETFAFLRESQWRSPTAGASFSTVSGS